MSRTQVSVHLLILDFFLHQVDVSADYVLVRDFRGAMLCLSRTLSITFSSFLLLLSSFHRVFFSFSKGSHGYRLTFFDRSPLLASNFVGETFHRPRHIRQDRPPLSVFLLSSS